MRIICILAALLPLAACSSIDSEFIGVGQEGGIVPGAKFHGVPVVLTVNDKLAFKVTETTYSNTAGNTYVEHVVDPAPIALPTPYVFAVDTERPAAGTAKNTISLTNEYPTSIATDVDDQTISTVAQAAQQFVNDAQEKADAAARGDQAPTDKVIKTESYLIVYDTRTRAFSRQQ
jgi:hypothetical protein